MDGAREAPHVAFVVGEVDRLPRFAEFDRFDHFDFADVDLVGDLRAVPVGDPVVPFRVEGAVCRPAAFGRVAFDDPERRCVAGVVDLEEGAGRAAGVDVELGRVEVVVRGVVAERVVRRGGGFGVDFVVYDFPGLEFRFVEFGCFAVGVCLGQEVDFALAAEGRPNCCPRPPTRPGATRARRASAPPWRRQGGSSSGCARSRRRRRVRRAVRSSASRVLWAAPFDRYQDSLLTLAAPCLM